MKKTQVTLSRRLKPTQARAKDTVELILATTASLLDEVGVEKFNTNLLAEKAGIRVRTIYRYFPNKYAVIFALTKALAVDWDRWSTELYKNMANPLADWRLALRENHVKWLGNARRVPGALSVLQAMNSTPELTDLHVNIFETMSRKFAAALRARGLKLTPIRTLSIARAVSNSMTTGLDILLRLKGKEQREFASELAASQEAYLELYLKDLPTPSHTTSGGKGM
jgi:AcrR family transcriptional regulator